MPAPGAVECTTCELHAEAVFRVEGMDCNEEVVILERRLRPLTGLEAVSADLIGQRIHIKYDAAKLTTGEPIHEPETGVMTGVRVFVSRITETGDQSYGHGELMAWFA